LGKLVFNLNKSTDENLKDIITFAAETSKQNLVDTLESYRRSGVSTQAQRRSMENLFSETVSLVITMIKRMMLLNDDMIQNRSRAARRQGAAEQSTDPMDQDKQDDKKEIEDDSFTFDENYDDQAYPESDLVGDVRRMG
jgi:hypothetical protein